MASGLRKVFTRSLLVEGPSHRVEGLVRAEAEDPFQHELVQVQGRRPGGGSAIAVERILTWLRVPSDFWLATSRTGPPHVMPLLGRMRRGEDLLLCRSEDSESPQPCARLPLRPDHRRGGGGRRRRGPGRARY